MKYPSFSFDALTAEMVNDVDAAISFDEVAAILSCHYGISGELNSLPGERDRNFLVVPAAADRLVLKISGPSEPRAVTDLQLDVHRWLAHSPCGLDVPRLQSTVAGGDYVAFLDGKDRPRIGRLLSYVSGRPLRSAEYSKAQRVSAGEASAKLTTSLSGFEHEAAKRDIIWDVVHGYRMEALLQYLPKVSRDVATALIARFRTDVAKHLSLLPHQVVHNDLNAGNLMTSPDDSSVITGVIDFGDILWTATIVDAAIGAASLLTPGCGLSAALSEYVQGYRRYRQPTVEETALFCSFVAMRLLMQMLIPAWYREKNPNNAHYQNFDAQICARTEWIGELLEMTDAHLQL